MYLWVQKNGGPPMKCHYCGPELQGNEIFCRYCGTRQTGSPVLESVPVTSEPMPVYEASAPVFEEPTPVYEEPAPVSQPVQEQPHSWKPYETEPAVAAKAAVLFDFEKPSLANAPHIELPTKRSLIKMIFLGILTLGIYPMVIWSRLVGEVNMVASRYDGERSMSFFGMVMLAPLTLGIHSLVWMHKLCRRIGAELQRRRVAYTFGAKDFWVWCFVMEFLCSICMGAGASLSMIGYETSVIIWVLLTVSLLTLIGPLVFLSKLMRAMNRLNEDFNING